MSEAERTEEAQIGLQFSLYPLRQAYVRPAIEAAMQAAAAEGVAVTVGRLSTFACGDGESHPLERVAERGGRGGYPRRVGNVNATPSRKPSRHFK